MNETERSILLYLLDAIRIAPDRSKSFIKIVNKKDRSEKFHSFLEELKNSENVAVTAMDIRERLR